MRKGYCKVLLSVLFFVSFLPFAAYSKIKNVDAVQLTKIKYQKNMQVSGVIEAGQKTEIKLSYPVCIDKCYVKNGDYVNQGQLLFTLDTEKMQKYVKSSSFTSGKTGSFTAETADLLSIPKGIYSASSGFIRELSAFDQSIVLANENLCIIEQDDSLLLKISINQEDYSKIKVGDTITFSPTIDPSKKYTATVCDRTATVRKEMSLTDAKTVIDIYAVPYSSDDFLTQGLQFTGSVSDNNYVYIYTLPYEYINQDEKGEYVNVYSAGKVTAKYVETGIETVDSVQIVTPFSPDTIFVKNSFKGKRLLNNA